ncbi:MAG: hypothetical protein ABI720_01190 [Actinomycetes bacterium]
MKSRRLISAALSTFVALGLGLALAPAASAAEFTITDPTGDTTARGLDIVSGVLDNDDYVMSGIISFRADRNGTLIVGLKARNRGLMRIVSNHRSGGAGGIRLIDNRGQRVDCDAMSIDWDTSAATATFTISSSCLWRGNFGGIRPWYLVEALNSGNDVDYATTRTFVSRG